MPPIKRYLAFALLASALLFSAPCFAGDSINNFNGDELISLTATTTASFGNFILPDSVNDFDCLVTNSGATGVFITFNGNIAVNTPTNNTYGLEYYIPANSSRIVFKDASTTISVISASGTDTVFFQSGSGS